MGYERGRYGRAWLLLILRQSGRHVVRYRNRVQEDPFAGVVASYGDETGDCRDAAKQKRPEEQIANILD
jgi:hypothetical protein